MACSISKQPWAVDHETVLCMFFWPSLDVQNAKPSYQLAPQPEGPIVVASYKAKVAHQANVNSDQSLPSQVSNQHCNTLFLVLFICLPFRKTLLLNEYVSFSENGLVSSKTVISHCRVCSAELFRVGIHSRKNSHWRQIKLSAFSPPLMKSS